MSKGLSMARRIAGWSALALSTASAVIALTIRDAIVPSEMIFFGVPWLLRIGLLGIAWILLRPVSRKCLLLGALVFTISITQGGRSYRYVTDSADRAGSFKVTLWNTGRSLWKMPREWPALVAKETKLVVLIEAGPFPDDTWQRFTATHPDLTWKQLEGGIVVGVRGRLIDTTAFGDADRFRCHRLRVEIDGDRYSVFAIDIPSQPWRLRQPYLDRIRKVAENEHCLILGDFNTPPEARGFDAWKERFTLANDSGRQGFRETWLYGLPVLTLDQLWLSRDLQNHSTIKTPTLRSDHVRMTFEVGTLPQGGK
ncbi:MAG: endonuclease/exonuclease/phosphatase family protein [Verrucomicrobiales bacterium]